MKKQKEAIRRLRKEEDLIRALAEMEINFKEQGYCLKAIFFFDLEQIFEDLLNDEENIL